MSDSEPIVLAPRPRGSAPTDGSGPGGDPGFARTTAFNRQELTAILDLYGRKVAAGLWRDYALDLMRDKAVFSVFRKASEFPLYRIEKDNRLARKQGAYAVVAAGGLVMKRGHDLRRVLAVLEDKPRLLSR